MCPSCGKAKMQFKTEKEAKLFIRFNGHEIHNNPEDLRIYYCDACCCYHITSKKYHKKYKYFTNNLIKAYYNDIKDLDKDNLIKEIKTLVDTYPNIFIKKCGKFHVTHFKSNGDIFVGLNDSGYAYELQQCGCEELTSMLNKITEKIRS